LSDHESGERYPFEGKVVATPVKKNKQSLPTTSTVVSREIARVRVNVTDVSDPKYDSLTEVPFVITVGLRVSPDTRSACSIGGRLEGICAEDFEASGFGNSGQGALAFCSQDSHDTYFHES
jgi:hypothetical protein